MKRLLILLLLVFPAPALAEEPEVVEVVSTEQTAVEEVFGAIPTPTAEQTEENEEEEPVAVSASTHRLSPKGEAGAPALATWHSVVSKRVHHKSRRHHKRHYKRH